MPVARWVPPATFDELKRIGEAHGHPPRRGVAPDPLQLPRQAGCSDAGRPTGRPEPAPRTRVLAVWRLCHTDGMGTVRQTIEPPMEAWLARQHMFFVATAPLAADQHVNLSPKGLDTLRVLSPTQVAYLDLTGSGVETIAHVRGERPAHPDVLRVRGAAADRAPLRPRHGARARRRRVRRARRRLRAAPRARAVVIVLDVERVADSCGYAVPLYEHRGRARPAARMGRGQGPDELQRLLGGEEQRLDRRPARAPGRRQVAAAAEAS